MSHFPWLLSLMESPFSLRSTCLLTPEWKLWQNEAENARFLPKRRNGFDSDQTVFTGQCGRLCAGLGAQLDLCVLQALFHRAFADAQIIGNLLQSQA